MALFTTFPELGASSGFGLSRATHRGWARPVTDGSLRPIGAASGGIRSWPARHCRTVCQVALSAAGRALLGGGTHPRSRARGNLSRTSTMVARLFRPAVDPVRGRGLALDRRLDSGVPWA